MWGEFVFHLYEENFIRLASMLDYAAAHPHVLIHVRLHAETGFRELHKWLAQLFDVFKIDRSRGVWGPISAKIAHVPEGMPCGEPYAQPQLLLREVRSVATSPAIRSLHLRVLPLHPSNFTDQPHALFIYMLLACNSTSSAMSDGCLRG